MRLSKQRAVHEQWAQQNPEATPTFQRGTEEEEDKEGCGEQQQYLTVSWKPGSKGFKEEGNCLRAQYSRKSRQMETPTELVGWALLLWSIEG